MEWKMIPYKGEELQVQVLHQRAFMRCFVTLRDDILYVETPVLTESVLREAVRTWYVEQARGVISRLVAEHAGRMGVTYGRIAIRGQRSRWGSCSEAGNLNFNWRLVMMPEHICEYVVVHELAHRKQLNHSKKFWKEVENALPDYRIRDEWLKKHGKEYMLISRELFE